MPGIIVDIGTGDGKFTYQLAKENPDRFIIGVDPSQKSMGETSGKIYKKKEKGGLKNALFVLADIENLPDELKDITNQVFINFPWGSLLKGIVLVENGTWDNIKKICQKEAIIDIILGYDKSREKKEIEKLGLPLFDLQYIQNEMAPKLENQGFTIIETREVERSELKDHPSSWAKKLSFEGDKRKYYYLRIKLK